jgi:CheY-like chemotaxis protein
LTRIKGTNTFRYRILVVDDEESIRTVAEAILKSQGYEVRCAVDGFDGLTVLKQSLPDVIISDLRMPNMNGFEFLSVVRKRFPHIAVVAISGDFSGLDVPESVLADAFFEKGQYSPEALFEKVADLLEELPIRPRVGRQPKPTVWVPLRTDADYIAVTCSSCLRTFPAPIPLSEGMHLAECDFCGTAVSFQISADFSELTARRRKESESIAGNLPSKIDRSA